VIVRSGNNNIAPIKKQTAPEKVPRFVKVKLMRTPVLGKTYEAIADTPKAAEPVKLSTAIHHGILVGFNDQKA
jgi:prophage DNA circulation protein